VIVLAAGQTAHLNCIPHQVISTLLTATKIEVGDRAPEARAAAVVSLAAMVEVLGIGGGGGGEGQVDGALASIHASVHAASLDYTVNSHGDVGSR